MCRSPPAAPLAVIKPCRIILHLRIWAQRINVIISTPLMANKADVRFHPLSPWRPSRKALCKSRGRLFVRSSLIHASRMLATTRAPRRQEAWVRRRRKSQEKGGIKANARKRLAATQDKHVFLMDLSCRHRHPRVGPYPSRPCPAFCVPTRSANGPFVTPQL